MTARDSRFRPARPVEVGLERGWRPRPVREGRNRGRLAFPVLGLPSAGPNRPASGCSAPRTLVNCAHADLRQHVQYPSPARRQDTAPDQGRERSRPRDHRAVRVGAGRVGVFGRPRVRGWPEPARIGRLTHKTCWATHSGSSSSRPRSRSEPAPIMRQGSSHSTRSTIHAPSRPGPTTSALVTTGSSSEPGPFIAAPRKVVNPLELIREIGS